MARMVHDVFLASPFEEFQQLRKLLNMEINKMASRFPIALVDLNDGAVAHSPPVKECITKAKQSDFMILLMGDTYGSYAPNENKSYTHLEYESVIYTNSPTVVLVFCIGDNYEGKNIKYSDDDNFKQFQLAVESCHTIGYFSKEKSIEDIGQKIIQELLIAVSTRILNGHMMQMPISSYVDKNIYSVIEENKEKVNLDVPIKIDEPISNNILKGNQNFKVEKKEEKVIKPLLKEEVEKKSSNSTKKVVEKTEKKISQKSAQTLLIQNNKVLLQNFFIKNNLQPFEYKRKEFANSFCVSILRDNQTFTSLSGKNKSWDELEDDLAKRALVKLKEEQQNSDEENFINEAETALDDFIMQNNLQGFKYNTRLNKKKKLIIDILVNNNIIVSATTTEKNIEKSKVLLAKQALKKLQNTNTSKNNPSHIKKKTNKKKNTAKKKKIIKPSQEKTSVVSKFIDTILKSASI